MLVLSRKIGEKINIGNDIIVQVTKICGSRVSVAIEAPKTTSIVRAELQRKDNPDAKQS
jgi:carbon storage regulator